MDFEVIKIIRFRAGSRHYAFRTHSVKEIVDTLDSVKRVSYGGDALKGVMNFGGNLISVLDLSFLLGMHEGGKGAMILICRDRDMDTPVGLIISSIKGMEMIASSSIKPSEDGASVYIEGIVSADESNHEEAVLLLNLKKLLDYAATKIVQAGNVVAGSDEVLTACPAL